MKYDVDNQSWIADKYSMTNRLVYLESGKVEAFSKFFGYIGTFDNGIEAEKAIRRVNQAPEPEEAAQ